MDEQLSRNIGIIGEKGQRQLMASRVGVAGCGGMGSAIAEYMARNGFGWDGKRGYLSIADSEVYDRSNMNRQLAATIDTLGKSKAMATFQRMEKVSDQVEVNVYTQGITAENADEFVKGLDLVL